MWRAVLMAVVVAGLVGEVKAEGVKVGTFDARSVALGYGRSKMHNDYVKGLMAERDKAKAAGDTKRVKELEAMGKGQQENAHRQVFGVGPYDSLVEQLKGVFAEVGKEEGVGVIVPKVYWTQDGVETVDVTEAILKKLGTDEKTRKIIEDMNEKIRTGKYKPEEYKGEH